MIPPSVTFQTSQYPITVGGPPKYRKFTGGGPRSHPGALDTLKSCDKYPPKTAPESAPFGDFRKHFRSQCGMIKDNRAEPASTITMLNVTTHTLDDLPTLPCRTFTKTGIPCAG